MLRSTDSMLAVASSILPGVRFLGEAEYEDVARCVFNAADTDSDGLINKSDLFNYFVTKKVDVSHLMTDKLFKQMSNGKALISVGTLVTGLHRYYKLLSVDRRLATSQALSRRNRSFEVMTSTCSNRSMPMMMRPSTAKTLAESFAQQKRFAEARRVAYARGRDLAKQKALEEDLRTINAVLLDVDMNRNGRISKREFQEYIGKTAPHLSRISGTIFNVVDRNTSGEVQFKEFLRVLYPAANSHDLQFMAVNLAPHNTVKEQNGGIQAQIQELKSIFAIYDDDGSGELGRDEFVEALSAAGYSVEEANHMFDTVDADHGGTVSLEEFIEWWQQSETEKPEI